MDAAEVEFCTLGMFILDDIHFPPPRSAVKNVLGGAGSYAAVGARLFSPEPTSKGIGWIVDCGSDFPTDLRTLIQDWKTACLMRDTPERLTTRGWNEYGENEYRAFRYLTPKLRLDFNSCSPDLLRSKSFHLICAPLRCIEQISGILRRRLEVDPNLARPIFVWEPVPDVCTPEERQNCCNALKLVDVVSPNHAELASFFGGTGQIGGDVDREAILFYAGSWLESGIGQHGSGSVVVRCGKEGCLIARRGNRSWIPAYHQRSDKVIDPTGGGNAFLGALCIALARGKNVEEASNWGAISASFAIEQIGVPTMKAHAEEELWNGTNVQSRLEEFECRLHSVSD